MWLVTDTKMEVENANVSTYMELDRQCFLKTRVTIAFCLDEILNLGIRNLWEWEVVYGNLPRPMSLSCKLGWQVMHSRSPASIA